MFDLLTFGFCGPRTESKGRYLGMMLRVVVSYKSVTSVCTFWQMANFCWTHSSTLPPPTPNVETIWNVCTKVKQQHQKKNHCNLWFYKLKIRNNNLQVKVKVLQFCKFCSHNHRANACSCFLNGEKISDFDKKLQPFMQIKRSLHWSSRKSREVAK
jgi:hypothetical protein